MPEGARDGPKSGKSAMLDFRDSSQRTKIGIVTTIKSEARALLTIVANTLTLQNRLEGSAVVFSIW